MVVLIPVLGHGLCVVARLAQRLPVFLVPEQLLVTSMGNDVVNNSGWHNLSLLLAADTQWMGSKKCLSGSLPSSVVSFLFCGLGVMVVERGVFLTVHRAVRNEPTTAGMFAGCVRSARHSLILPGKPSLTEMTVGTDLVVVHIQQSQRRDNSPRCQIVFCKDVIHDVCFRDAIRTKAIHIHRNRLGNTNGIGQLDFTSVSILLANDVLCNVAGGIGSTPIHLCRVFAGEGTATVTAHTAVGIGDDFSSSQTRVRKRRTHHETPSRIDQLFKVGIQTIVLGCSLHDRFHNGANILNGRTLQMLGTDKEGGDPAAFIIIGNLALGIGEQNRTAYFPEKLQCVCRYRIGNRQHFRGLVCGIAEHHALISRSGIPIHTEGDICTLFADECLDTEILRTKNTDTLKNLSCKSLIVGGVAGSNLASDDDVKILYHTLSSDTASFIMGQTIGDDGIRNLVADFIRVPTGHLLTCKYHTDKSSFRMYGCVKG
nr:MAG TPA: hypothetical protein [Caudoviricetes sp.]